MRLLPGIAFGLVLSTALASPATAIEPDAPDRLLTRLDAVGIAVEKRLAAPFRHATSAKKRDHGALVAFYTEHDNELVWVDENGPTAKARKAIAELKRAGDYGLDAKDYDLPQLGEDGAETSYDTNQLAEIELKLSHAALAYARHARGGRIVPSRLSKYLDPTLELPEPLGAMEKFAQSSDVAATLRDYQPQHPQFETLRQKLLETRGSSLKQYAPVPKGPLIRPGQKHPHVALTRKRLEVPVRTPEGASAADPELYDSDLEDAVKAFQKRHGLRAEGIIGPATRRAMNARPKNPVKKILANMERWRWVPREVGELHVRVNIPEFRIRVFEDGKSIHTERVVVGKLKNQTPIFSDEMERIVFNPYWNIPNSIKVKEILPYLKRDGGGGGFFGGGGTTAQSRFVQRNNLRIKYRGRPVDPASVDWSSVDVRRFHFFQPPGGPNVLGDVKFMFPNKHIVYMHDTPTKRLFNQPVRAYSHGCMRIRNPKRLAEVLLSRDSGWTMTRINRAIGSGKNWPVNLKTKIPVHMTYFTAWVDENGKMRYARDIYGHDARMIAALKL